MLKHKCLRVLAVALSLLLLLPTGAARATDAIGPVEEPRRVIHVVYDDSGSMYGEDNDTWSQALYAMEIFAAMLGDQDEMSIYRMSDYNSSLSDFRPISLVGSDAGTIAALPGQIAGNGYTPFETVTAAGEALKQADPNADRWLVVLTDGMFSTLSIGEASQKLHDYTDQGIQVVYLAIGSGAGTMNGDPVSGFYTYQANTSGEILGRITSIANQIFKQQILPANHVQVSGNTITMDIDMPVQQILVFAQGINVTVDSLAREGTKLQPVKNIPVKVGQNDIPAVYAGERIKVAEGLSGVVQTYRNGSGLYEKGTHTLDVSDTSNVEVYYIPGAEIECVLIDSDGRELSSAEEHYAGDYGIEMRFVDPTNGETIVSDLLGDAQLYARLTNGDQVYSIDSTVNGIHLDQGDVTLEAYAMLPGNVFVKTERQYRVYPQPIQLDLSVETQRYQEILLLEDPEGAEPILVTARDHGTGKTLSKELWQQIGAEGLTVTSTCQQGSVNWDVTLGKDKGTWELRPSLAGISEPGTGNVTLSIQVDCPAEDTRAYGACTAESYIAPYVVSEMRIEFEIPDERTEAEDAPEDAVSEDPAEDAARANLHLGSIRNETGVLLRLSLRDESTGIYHPMTQAQFEKMTAGTEGAEGLTLQCVDSFSDGENALKWQLVPTNEEGVYQLVLAMQDPEKLAYSLKHVDQVVEVRATAEGRLIEESLVYEGTGSGAFTVHTMTWAEIFSRIGIYVILIALILFVLLGHLLKRKLKWKRLNPTAEDVETGQRVGVAKKRVWVSYILPWVPQRAVISAYVPALHCRFDDLHIKAAGSGMFYVTNIQSYISSRMSVDGKTLEGRPPKKKRAHMTLQYLDEMGEPIGRVRV